MRVTSVLMDEKVVNETSAIFFPHPRCIFEMLRFEVEGDLCATIQKAYKYLFNIGWFPKVVFIPFFVYGEYEKQTDVTDPLNMKMPITMVCEEKGFEFVVMIPNILKDKVSQISNIDEEI